MKRLVLLRHAKAVAGATGQDDFERALTERGREDAALIGDYMRGKPFSPDLILCSDAKRTRETLECWSARVGEKPRSEFRDALYLAEPQTLLSIARAAPDSTTNLMLIGHNPGMEQAVDLLRTPSGQGHCSQGEKFPTCAVAVLEFAIGSWKRLAPGEGLLTDFTTPKDLNH